jgi:hypothetical protein
VQRGEAALRADGLALEAEHFGGGVALPRRSSRAAEAGTFQSKPNGTRAERACN